MSNQDLAGRIMAHAFHDEMEKIALGIPPDLAAMGLGLAAKWPMQAAWPVVKDAFRGALRKNPIRKGTFWDRGDRVARADLQQLVRFLKTEGKL